MDIIEPQKDRISEDKSFYFLHQLPTLPKAPRGNDSEILNQDKASDVITFDRRLKIILLRHGNDGTYPGQLDDPDDTSGESIKSDKEIQAIRSQELRLFDTGGSVEELLNNRELLKKIKIDRAFYTNAKKRVAETAHYLIDGYDELALQQEEDLTTSSKIPGQEEESRDALELGRDYSMKKNILQFRKKIFSILGDETLLLVTSTTNIHYLVKALINYRVRRFQQKVANIPDYIPFGHGFELDFEGNEFKDQENNFIIKLKDGEKIFRTARDIGIPLPENSPFDALGVERAIKEYFKEIDEEKFELLVRLLGCDQVDLSSFALRVLIKTAIDPATIRQKRENIFHAIVLFYTDSKNQLPKRTPDREILFEYIDIPEVRSLIGKLFITRPSEWLEKDVFELFSQQNESEWYETLLRKREAYNKAADIQKRSVDETIQNNEPTSIFQRDLLIKRTTKYCGITRESDLPISTKEIVSDDYSYVLPAHVGFGKSIWITELVKTLCINFEKEFVFFEARDFGNATLSEFVEILLRRLADQYKRETTFQGNDLKLMSIESLESVVTQVLRECKVDMLLFDAIDELGDENEKIKIKKLIELVPIKKIITARPSEYSIDDNASAGLQTLSFIPTNKEEFIKSKAPEQLDHIVKFLQNSNLIHEIDENLLLLYFICFLAKIKPCDAVELGVHPLDDLKNIDKANLYENVIKLIVIEFERKNKTQKPLRVSGLEKYFDYLSNLAVSITVDGDITEQVQMHGDIFERINILFKKDQNETYYFVHDSFREFFVYYFRKKSFLKRESKDWFGILENLIGFNFQHMLASSAFKSFEDFEYDYRALMQKGIGQQKLSSMIGAIAKVRSPKGLRLLDEIDMTESYFTQNQGAVTNFCFTISKIKDTMGLSILEKLDTSAAYFNDNPSAIANYCEAIFQLNDPEGLILLSRIDTNSESFKNNPKAIYKFLCSITLYLSTTPQLQKAGHILLSRLNPEWDVFKDNNDVFMSLCLALGVSCYPNSIPFLLNINPGDEQIKKNHEAIYSFCYVVRKTVPPPFDIELLQRIDTHDESFIDNPDALKSYIITVAAEKKAERLKLLFDIDINHESFYKDPEVLNYYCLVIGTIGDPLGLELLDRIDTKAETFTKNYSAVTLFSKAVGLIEDSLGIKSLDKIDTKLDSFKKNPEAIMCFCIAIMNCNNPEGLFLLERLDFESDNLFVEPSTITSICRIIWSWGNSQYLYVLKQIAYKINTFKGKKCYETITNFCLAVIGIGTKESLSLLTMIDFEADSFKSNPKAIANFCAAIMYIPDYIGLSLLSKVDIRSDAFKKDKKALINYFTAIENINHRDGMKLLVYVDLDDDFLKNDREIVDAYLKAWDTIDKFWTNS